ncbi:MAG: hypothetical protein ACREXR_02815 [Gammaproteobacteria bacterium]
MRDWLADNPNIIFHRTPVGVSWINQIEIWFGLITRQSIRRGTFSSSPQSRTTSPTGMPTANPSPGSLMSTRSSPRSVGLSRKSTSLRDTGASLNSTSSSPRSLPACYHRRCEASDNF